MTEADISLQNIGKKFGKEWIFRGITLKIPAGEKWVILGGNGSGKSTLLQVICGYITPAEGSVQFLKGGAAIPDEETPAYISFASPYLQLVDDLTAEELVAHISHYKKFRGGISAAEVLKIAQLDHASPKFIRQF